MLGLCCEMSYILLQEKKELKIPPRLMFYVSVCCHDRCDASRHRKIIFLCVYIKKCDIIHILAL
jgi:hypothetical protein